MIKSWTGIIYLGYENETLRSFLEALKQIPKKQDSQIRKVIFSTIEEILSIGDNLISTEGIYLSESIFVTKARRVQGDEFGELLCGHSDSVTVGKRPF